MEAVLGRLGVLADKLTVRARALVAEWLGELNYVSTHPLAKCLDKSDDLSAEQTTHAAQRVSFL